MNIKIWYSPLTLFSFIYMCIFKIVTSVAVLAGSNINISTAIFNLKKPVKCNCYKVQNFLVKFYYADMPSTHEHDDDFRPTIRSAILESRGSGFSIEVYKNLEIKLDVLLSGHTHGGRHGRTQGEIPHEHQHDEHDYGSETSSHSILTASSAISLNYLF